MACLARTHCADCLPLGIHVCSAAHACTTLTARMLEPAAADGTADRLCLVLYCSSDFYGQPICLSMQDLFKAKVVTDHKCSHPVCHTCKSTIKEDAKRCPDCRRQLGRCGAAMWELTQPLGFPEVLCVDISRAVSSRRLPAGLVKSLLLRVEVLPVVLP